MDSQEQDAIIDSQLLSAMLNYEGRSVYLSNTSRHNIFTLRIHIFIVVHHCRNMKYTNFNAFFISDAVVAASLSLYDGVDDDQLMAAAELAENTTSNEQAAVADVKEWSLTDSQIISATCKYLPCSNLIYYSLI